MLVLFIPLLWFNISHTTPWNQSFDKLVYKEDLEWWQSQWECKSLAVADAGTRYDSCCALF